jgi:hypothetical protein
MALLSDIPTLVGLIAMQNALGATMIELIALAEKGLLAPRTRIPSVRKVWRIADGEAFVARLRPRAVTVTANEAEGGRSFWRESTCCQRVISVHT